jgi:hypothetical protein
MSDFIKGLWPQSLFTWLGLTLGAMSVLALIQHGFDYGFGPTFTLLLAYYENLVHAVLGWWAEPIFRRWVANLNEYLGWDLQLHPHWRHAFVFMGLFLFRFTVQRFQEAGFRASVVFAAAVAVAVTIVTSFTVGAIPLAGQDRWADFLTVAVPLLGIALFSFIDGVRWAITVPPLIRADNRAPVSHVRLIAAITAITFGPLLIALALAFGALQLPLIQRLKAPGVLILGVLIIALAVNLMRHGIRAARIYRAHYASFGEALALQGPWRLGVAVLGVFFWTGLFIAANAGLRFYGL